MGTIRTTRDEYLVVNRTDMLKVVMTPDQQLEIDPNSEYFSVKQPSQSEVESLQQWAQQSRRSVQGFSDQGRLRYHRILDRHAYPENPPKPPYTSDHTEAVRLNAQRQENGFDYILGDTVRPDGEWARFINMNDTIFDPPGERTNPGGNWFEMRQQGYGIVRVTKPEFVEKALKTGIEMVKPPIPTAPSMPPATGPFKT